MPVRISKNRVALENIPLNEALGANIASATTINLTTATGNTVHVTGTTSITAVTLGAGMIRNVIFDGVLTLTHHATTNNLPGGANITTAVNDRARYIGDGTTVYCVNYQKADGTAVVASLNINGLTAETSPATGDEVPIYDLTATANRKMTRQNFMKWDFESAATAITTTGVTAIAHGLGAIPVEVQVFIECVTAEHGWAVGDLVEFVSHSDSGISLTSWGCDATNVLIALSGTILPGNNKTTAGGVSLTTANWRYRVKARV